MIHSWGNKILFKFIKLKANKESVMVKDPTSVLYPFLFYDISNKEKYF